MYNSIFALVLGFLASLRPVHCIPTPFGEPEDVDALKGVDARSESATCVQSIYICQNYNWQPPCLNYCLGASQNNQQLFWMAPAPGGPGPYQDSNYTIGSWGPSQGLTTYWVNQQNDYSEWYYYPGTGQVDDYWSVNIWTFYAFWGQ